MRQYNHDSRVGHIIRRGDLVTERPCGLRGCMFMNKGEEHTIRDPGVGGGYVLALTDFWAPRSTLLGSSKKNSPEALLKK